VSGPKRKAARARGYILAEALVSAAIASLAGALAVTLLIWSAEAIDRAQSGVGATRELDRLYEESRLMTPDDLGRPASGVAGRYHWVRSPTAPLDRDNVYSPVPVRFTVRWMSGGRLEQMSVQAIVRPSPAAAAP
jgi:hypothetical protein